MIGKDWLHLLLKQPHKCSFCEFCLFFLLLIKTPLKPKFSLFVSLLKNWNLTLLLLVLLWLIKYLSNYQSMCCCHLVVLSCLECNPMDCSRQLLSLGILQRQGLWSELSCPPPMNLHNQDWTQVTCIWRQILCLLSHQRKMFIITPWEESG